MGGARSEVCSRTESTRGGLEVGQLMLVPKSGLFRKSEFTDKALEMNGPPSKYGPDVAWPGASQATEVWESHALFSGCQRVRGPVKFL